MRESNFSGREALMKATLAEFSQINYDNASLNRIIKAAGISKGTFYYHFKNKEELYTHLMNIGTKAKWDYINDYTKEHQADFSQMDVFDKFLYQAKAGAMFAREYPDYNKLANMFTKEKGSDIYNTIVEAIGGDSNNLLEQMIHTAYETGELDTSYTESFIIQLLGNLFSHFDEIFTSENSIERDLKNLEEYVRFMKHGLKAPS